MAISTDTYARLADNVYSPVDKDEFVDGTTFMLIDSHADETGYFGAIYWNAETKELNRPRFSRHPRPQTV